MKRWLWPTLGLLLTVIIIFATGCEGITSPPPRTTAGAASGQNTGIWVTGTGEVSVTPDIAVLLVGVEAQETTVAAAQAKASGAMDSVMASLTESGLKKEDIQTQYFRIRQRTRWDDRTQQEVVTGYQVTNQVTARIRDIGNVSGIIDAVVRAGGDLIRINDLNFSVEDPSRYYDEARQKATADAKTKAEKLAKQAGVKLGTPTYIAESAMVPQAYGGIMYSQAAGPVPAPMPAPAPPPVSPGEVKVSLTVQIAYGIR
ncbi:MAG TPA: SIMPL domain-containing protein [Dehalococcoidales bacterium]|nr:SIMPL domain-containing protein [Dehalococcoidales bacterium]